MMSPLAAQLVAKVGVLTFRLWWRFHQLQGCLKLYDTKVLTERQILS